MSDLKILLDEQITCRIEAQGQVAENKKHAELGRLAVEAINNFEHCKGKVKGIDCILDCDFQNFCKKRAELLGNNHD